MAEAPSGQRCGTCRFWRAWSGQSALVHVGLEAARGACRAHPPVPHGSDTRSPNVASDWWCGEYEPEHPQSVSEAMAALNRFVAIGDLSAAYALIDKLQESRETPKESSDG